jgi:hypothetical protein
MHSLQSSAHSHSNSTPTSLPSNTDILILGATASNLSAALDITYHAPNFRVTLTDATKPEVFDEDELQVDIKQPMVRLLFLFGLCCLLTRD